MPDVLGLVVAGKLSQLPSCGATNSAGALIQGARCQDNWCTLYTGRSEGYIVVSEKNCAYLVR